MENPRQTRGLDMSRNWVGATLLPSIASGSVGGALTGSVCGLLLAPSRHLLEAAICGVFAGATVGFVITWVGAAAVGIISLCHSSLMVRLDRAKGPIL